MADFASTGCDWCRQYWLGGGTNAVERLGISVQNQAEYVRCPRCRQLWENPNGNYPRGVSASELPDDLPGRPRRGWFRR